MAKVRPFSAIMPAEGKEGSVTTQSFISYSKSALEAQLSINPFSFLHVLKPSKKGLGKKISAEQNYTLIRESYEDFLQRGILKRDKKPCFYVYKQRLEEHIFTGIIALVSVDDYLGGKIKKHEETLTRKEASLATYLDKVKINADPVCLCYQSNRTINEMVAKVQKGKNKRHFTSSDGQEHWLWQISDEAAIESIEQAFEKVDSLYIADGHHRAASSAKYAEQKRAENNNFSGEEPYDFFMGILFPEEEMDIHEFNRVVKDLNGLSESDFLERLKEDFEVKRLFEAARPKTSGKIHLYLNKELWELTVKAHCLGNESLSKNLDSCILTEKVLKKLLGIEDIKDSKRVDFVSGTEGFDKLIALVEMGKFRAAFILHSVTFQQIKDVADNNEFMPPKSTWVRPKMRSALTIYELD